jgi:medium-chain acyl-[acyl-carrier-protein] hydrolase
VWFPHRRPNRSPRLRLFCFPYAGGSASIYREWANRLPPEIELCAVQPPGREGRFSEQPFTHMGDLVAAAASALEPYLRVPYALFGHSLGAAVAYEVARRLASSGCEPLHLFVSGRSAPHLPLSEPPTAGLSDAAFLDYLRVQAEVPPAVLDSGPLSALFLPMLRADFGLSDTYVWRPGPRLGCPVSAFGGVDDPSVEPLDLAAWSEVTRAAFRLRFFRGAHFYLHQQPDPLVGEITRRLLSTPGSTRRP